jgi:hypothetical protein
MFIHASLLAMALMAASATAALAHDDPAHTDGDKYKVVFENDKVRVLEYKDLPGEITHQHRHPDFVLYAVSAFKRKIKLPDGKEMVREFKGGEVMWSNGQVHVGENVGTTPTHVIMIELKK